MKSNDTHLFIQWTTCIIDKYVQKDEIGKHFDTELKSILKLIELQSLVAKFCKVWKIYNNYINFVKCGKYNNNFLTVKN